MPTEPHPNHVASPGLDEGRRLRVCVFGNSVGLKMRPRRRHRGERTYTELLMRSHQVRNACRAGALISEQFACLDDDVIAWYPDVTILNFGMVELFHRTTLRHLNNLPIVNYYNNRLMGRPYRFASAWRAWALRAANGVTRRAARLAGAEWRWLPTEHYLEVLKAMCDTILAETASKVIVIEMAPTPTDSSKYSATTHAEMSRVNETVRGWAAAGAGRLVSLRLDEGVTQAQWHRLMPDGVHFSAVGHRCMHALLRPAIR